MALHKIIVRRSTTICLSFVFASACCLHCAMVLIAPLTSRSFKCSFWMSSWAGSKLRVFDREHFCHICLCIYVFLRRRVGFCLTLFVCIGCCFLFFDCCCICLSFLIHLLEIRALHDFVCRWRRKCKQRKKKPIRTNDNFKIHRPNLKITEHKLMTIFTYCCAQVQRKIE